MKNHLARRLAVLAAALLALVAAPRPADAQPGGDFYVLTLQPGFNLVANQLDAAPDNSLPHVFPSVAPGTQCHKWNESTGSYDIDTYLPGAGWIDNNGSPSTTTVGPREGFFLFNPGTPQEIIVSGMTRTNGPPPPLSRGVFHHVSGLLKAPATAADLVGEASSDGLLIIRYLAASQTYQTNTFSNCVWSPSIPLAEIGEGVIIRLPTNPPPPALVVPGDIYLFGCDPTTPVQFSAMLHTNIIKSCFPPPGTLFALGATPVTCTATNECGEVLSSAFQVVIRPPVAAWPWPSPLPGLGFPIEPLGGATVEYRGEKPRDTNISLPSPGHTTLLVRPDPLDPNGGIRLLPGRAQTISFKVRLPFDLSMGHGFDVHLPPSSANTNDVPLLSFRSKGAKGYCVKTNKRFADSPDGALRAHIVNTNGHLFDPLEFTNDECRTNDIVVIGYQPGVTEVHVAIEISLADGSITLNWDGPVVHAAGRKGWDGCIYGPDRPPKKAQARLYVGPPPYPGAPPIEELLLRVSGLTELPLLEPALGFAGRKWGDGHVTLMKITDDAGEQRLAFTPLGPGGSVVVDTGYSASYDFRLAHLAPSDVPGFEQLLTHTYGEFPSSGGPVPGPVLMDSLLMRASSPDSVDYFADFSPLGSPTVRVELYDHGMLVAVRANVPADLDTLLFTAPGFPTRLGKLGGPTPCRRGKPPFGIVFLPPLGPLPPEAVQADEFRVLAEIPATAPHPIHYTGLEFVASPGSTWAVSQLQTTSALTAPFVVTTVTPDTTITCPPVDGFHYIGADNVLGPWIDLGSELNQVPATNAVRVIQLRESPTRQTK